jgi:hypothetical protein
VPGADATAGTGGRDAKAANFSLFDSPKKSLHNLVSLLLTQQKRKPNGESAGETRRQIARRCGGVGRTAELLFKNETTDKCGRLMFEGVPAGSAWMCKRSCGMAGLTKSSAH